ncbi:MAG: amidophosphoribosyltransferase [Candidatus Omnitrophica bacterium]|nr:amidophosphoribosyltransferase [Candidatus Omnitrophota bacterium]
MITDPHDDKLREECGVFGIFNHPRATDMTYLGLFALQHRGEEAAGIVSSDGKNLYLHKNVGLVSEVFNEEKLKHLPGSSAIGHVRYSTSGSSTVKNAQPYMSDYSRGQIAVAHNGNLTNARVLRDELEAYGSIFGSTSDSEIIIHLMAKPTYRAREDALMGTARRIQGAYSMVMLTENMLIGLRDPYGFRPLCLGKMDGGVYVLASETCAFDLLGAKYVRDIEPGEIILIDASGLRSLYPFKGKMIPRAHCMFEFVYFSRPDSLVFGKPVGSVRENLGRQLAKEHPVDADIVIPVPDSGNFAAVGYSMESGIPYKTGFTRNHYVGRTFISPAQSQREFKVKIKLNPVRAVIEGNRVIVVDDSIVRGNTARNRVKTLREAGAKEVHMRISCPPHVSPCFYGIDFPDPSELLASRYNMEEIKKFLNVDSIGYLSIEGLLRAAGARDNQYCMACWDKVYKCSVIDEMDKFGMEKQRRS